MTTTTHTTTTPTTTLEDQRVDQTEQELVEYREVFGQQADELERYGRKVIELEEKLREQALTHLTWEGEWHEQVYGLQDRIRELEAEVAKAVAFRLAFYRAAESFSKAGELNRSQQAAWAELYRVVTDSDAGLELLAELERLRGCS